MIARSQTLHGPGVLLPLLAATLFLVPFVPLAWQSIAYRILGSLIILAVWLLATRVKFLLPVIVVAVLIRWVDRLWLQMPWLQALAEVLQLAIFVFGVGLLIVGVARQSRVNLRVILEGITGFLLLGFAYGIIVSLFLEFQPQAFSIDVLPEYSDGVSLYYSFVTLTTLGYGDIVPLSTQARALAQMIAISGQLYTTVLIALLVGKYLSQEQGQ